MRNVLIINASSRGDNSFSRKLTRFFEREWTKTHPSANFTYRELGKSHIPHITEDWIEGAFKSVDLRTKEEKLALKFSDELVEELKSSDIIVLGSPMYNWSIPSSLKAYIDQVLRMNRTLTINPEMPKSPYVGLLKGKKAYFLLVQGGTGYGPGEFYHHMDFQTKYLKTVFNIIGISDTEVISMDSTAMGEGKSQISFETCKQSIETKIHKY